MSKRLRNLTLFALVSLTLAVSATLTYLTYLQAVDFAYPVQGSHGALTPADLGARDWRDVEITTADEVRLSAWYVPPPAEARPGPAVLFAHGIGGNRSLFVGEAAFFIERGYGVLLLDLRNAGLSQSGVTSVGLHEAQDVMAGFDFLAAQSEINPARIVLYGASMGGAAVLMALPQLPEAQAVIIDATYTDWLGLVRWGVTDRVGFPGFPFGDMIVGFMSLFAGDDVASVRPLDKLAALEGRPFFYMHGTRDAVIPVLHGLRFCERTPQPEHCHIIEGAGHSNIQAYDPQGYERRMEAFLSALD